MPPRTPTQRPTRARSTAAHTLAHTLAVVVALLVGLVCPAPAFAQQFPGSSLLAPTAADDAPTIDLIALLRTEQDDFGDAIPAERFFPLTVLLGPGKAGGFMTVEYAQDATQNAMTVVPFATTPDKATPITVVAALPAGLDRITITLYDAMTSAVIRRAVFAMNPQKDEQPLPVTPMPGMGLVGVVGSIESMAGAFETIRARSGTDGPLSWVSLARIAPGELPRVWMGYDALDTLVVRSSDTRRVTRSSLAAIRQWVQSGGWLVLIIDDDARDWRRWLPRGEAGELLDLTEPLPGSIGRELFDMLDPQGADTPATITRRTLALAPDAAAAGWTTRWHTPSGALLAQGPVGLGMVTALTVDPARAFPATSSELLADAWADALAGPIDRIEALTNSDDATSARGMSRMNQFGSMGSSGANTIEKQALTSSIERMAQIPPIGHGQFIIIAASILALALLVGPIDAVVLKKLKLRNRSWLTAIGWIALATLAAYSAPQLIHRGPTRVGRAVALDLIADPPGTNALSRSSRGFATGITTIFASAPLRTALHTEDRKGWWRGVSTAWFRAGGRTSFPPLTTVQVLSAPDAGNPPPEGPSLAMGLWTFRAMMDQGPASLPIAATITRDAPDAPSYHLTVAGLPSGWQIHWAHLRLDADTAVGAVLTEQAPGEYSGTTIDPEKPNPSLAMSAPTRERSPGRASTQFDAAQTYGRDMPGADRRTSSITRRVDGPGWVAIELFMVGPDDGTRMDLPWPIGGPGLDVPAKHAGELTLRLLVPVDPSLTRPAPGDRAPQEDAP